MAQTKLYNVAAHDVEIIERMEHTVDLQKLADLEEQRVMWHNRLLRILKRERISFRDREHVTRLAFHIVRGSE